MGSNRNRKRTKLIPRENAYVCQECLGVITTVDVAEGVTPMFISCKATPGCTGNMVSRGYPQYPRPADVPAPTYEWYRPSINEARAQELRYPGSFEHWRQGGLTFRARTDAEPVYHENKGEGVE